MTKPLVVHLISGLNVGGAETMLKRVVLAMRTRGWESEVVSLIEPGPIGVELDRAGIPVVGLGMRRGRVHPSAALRLFHRLRRRRPAILQTWLYHADLLGGIVGSALRLPAVVWNVRAADLDMSRYRRLSAWTLQACALVSRWPRAIVFNSLAGREFHESIGYRPRRAYVIPNGYDCSEFRPDAVSREQIRRELEVTSEQIVIGLVARWDPMKDHETFFRAAGILARQRPGIRFVLAGEGVTAQNRDVERRLAQEDLATKVRLLGPRRDVARLYRGFDIGSLSSRSEGHPNTVGEAMASGVPCVVTGVGDAAEIVGPTGVVVPKENPAALAQGWASLIDRGPDGLRTLGEQARSRIQGTFEISKVIDQYEALYSDLLAGAATCAA